MSQLSDVRRTHRSADQWRKLIDAQSRSGASIVAFCAAEGLAPSSFHLWRAKLGASTPAFDELTPALLASHTNTLSIELDLGHGVVLRITR